MRAFLSFGSLLSLPLLVVSCGDPAPAKDTGAVNAGEPTATGSDTTAPPASTPGATTGAPSTTAPTPQPTPTTTATSTPVPTSTTTASTSTPVPTSTMTPEPEPEMGTGGMPMTPTEGGGGAGGSAGDGAMGDGGSAGSDAEAGAGGMSTEPGGKPEPDPSDGCGTMSPETGSSGSPLNVSNHQYYVKLPNDYDADTPYPVMFMFHPTNNPLNWAEQNSGFETVGSQDTWIRVYPGAGNNASGWNGSDVDFFEPLYDTITANFCVDRARVFASGESSGGDFSSILGCEFAHLIRATAPCATKPVNGYALNAESRPCTGQVAAVIIHGAMDNVVGPENGPATRDFYTALNHCGSTSQPVEGYDDNMSNCVLFDDCDDGYPVYWCQHQDPEYSNTNHGWPRFAGRMIYETFSQY